jgi:hypothetical protein
MAASTGAVLGIVGGAAVVLGVGAYFAFRRPAYPSASYYPTVSTLRASPPVAAAAVQTTGQSSSLSAKVTGLLASTAGSLAAKTVSSTLHGAESAAKSVLSSVGLGSLGSLF